MSLNELDPQRGVKHPHAFEFCVCGVPRWRHPPTQADVDTFWPHHLFRDPDLGDDIVVLRRGPSGRFTKL